MSEVRYAMAGSRKIRVLVADDHDIVRRSLIALLEQEEDIVVVGEACDGLEARNRASTFSPDIVLMDAKMPIMDGFAATARIAKELPQVKVLAVTQLGEEYARRFMKCGASGYVTKSHVAQELRHAIREVYGGRQYCSPSLSSDPIGIRSGRGKEPRFVLTSRERDVLGHIAHGLTDQEISTALHIGVRIVEFHRANLIEKLGAADSASLVRCAVEQKLIQLDPVRD